MKGKRQNTLSEENKARIIATYQNRTEAPRYSRRVEMGEPERSGTERSEIAGQPNSKAASK